MKKEKIKMREIKFRAWDGEVMHYDYLVARPQFCNVLSVLQDESFAKKTYKVKEWKLMQSTGIKDTFGKDIYEGDIMRIHENGKNYPLNYLVVFNEDELGFRNRWTGRVEDKHPGFYDIRISERGNKVFEIIGNIYTNPELIELKH